MARLPPGSRMTRTPSKSQEPSEPEWAPPDPVEYEPEEPLAPSRGDAVRQLARDLGIRPREARRVLARQEAIDASDEPPPPPLKVKRQYLEELRALGWLTPEQEAHALPHVVD